MSSVSKDLEFRKFRTCLLYTAFIYSIYTVIVRINILSNVGHTF